MESLSPNPSQSSTPSPSLGPHFRSTARPQSQAIWKKNSLALKVVGFFLVPLIGILSAFFLLQSSQDVRQQAKELYALPASTAQMNNKSKDSSTTTTTTTAQKKENNERCSNNAECVSNNCLAVPGGKYCQPAGVSLGKIAEGQPCATNAFDRECAAGLVCSNNKCVKADQVKIASIGNCLGVGESCEGGRGYSDHSCGGRNIRCGTSQAPALPSAPGTGGQQVDTITTPTARISNGRCLAPGETCASGSHFDALCPITETRCGTASVSSSLSSSAQTPALDSLIPDAPPSEREALTGPLTCAGGIAGGQVVLGAGQRIYECNGQTGLMVDRTKDGYTFADLTVKPVGISADDLTASLATYNALTAGQVASSKSCSSANGTPLSSGSVAIGNGSQRMRCNDGRWEACPNCALTVIPQYLYNDLNFQKELEERKQSQADAQDQYNQTLAECRSQGKDMQTCHTLALTDLTKKQVPPDLVSSIDAHFQAEQVLETEYLPQLEKYNVCLAQNNGQYQTCASYAHELNKLFASQGINPAYKQYIDNEGYLAYVVSKVNEVYSAARQEYEACLSRINLGENVTCTDPSPALAHPNLPEAESTKIATRFDYFQSNTDICAGQANCNPTLEREQLLIEAGFDEEERDLLQAQYHAHVAELALQSGANFPQLCSYLATSATDAERCYSDMGFMRSTILANIDSATRASTSRALQNFQDDVTAAQALQVADMQGILSACRDRSGGILQFRAVREKCSIPETAQLSVLNSLPESLQPPHTIIIAANGRETPLFAHQAACNSAGRCVAAGGGNTRNLQVQTVDLNSPYAFSCPSSCAVVGAGSGTTTVETASSTLPNAPTVTVTTQCSPDGGSVQTTRKNTTGTNLVGPSTTTTKVCDSGICSAGTCVEGAVRAVLVDEDRNIYGQRICEVGQTCEVVDPHLGIAYTTTITQTTVDGKVIFEDRIQGTSEEVETYNQQVRAYVLNNPDITNEQFAYDLTEFQITHPGTSYADFLAYKQREAIQVIKDSEGHLFSWLTGRTESEKIFQSLVANNPSWFVEGVVGGRIDVTDFSNQIKQIGQNPLVYVCSEGAVGEECTQQRETYVEGERQNALRFLVESYNESLPPESRDAQFARISSNLINENLEVYRLGNNFTASDAIDYQVRQLEAAAFISDKTQPHFFTESELADPTILARITRNPTLNSFYENFYVNDAAADNLVNALQGNFDYIALQNRYENDAALQTAVGWNNTLTGAVVRGYLAIEQGGDEWNDGNYLEGAYHIARGNVMIAAKPVGVVASGVVVGFNCVTNACLGNIPLLAATGGQALATYGAASAVGDVAIACDLTVGSGTDCARAGVNLAINAAFLRTAAIGVAQLGKTGTALADDAFNVAEKMVVQQQTQNGVRTTLDTLALNTTRYVAPAWFGSQGIDCFQQEGTNKVDCGLMIAQAGVTALSWHPSFQTATGVAKQNALDFSVNSAQAAVACSIGLQTGDTAACTQAVGGAFVSGTQVAAGHGTPDSLARLSENGESLSALGELHLAQRKVTELYNPDGTPLENITASVRTGADDALRQAIYSYATEEMQLRLALQTIEGESTTWSTAQKNLLSAQKLFLDSQQAYNKVLADKVPDLLNSPEFGAYNSIRNTLGETFQNVVREQYALTPSGARSSNPDIQKNYDDAYTRFERITKLSSPGDPMYEDAFRQLVQAKNAVETADYTGAQKNIQENLLAKQAARIALEEQVLLARKEIELVKNQEAARIYAEEINTRYSRATQQRNSLGDGILAWDATSKSWKTPVGITVTDLVATKYTFDATGNVWRSNSDNSVVDITVVTAEQNRLVDSARQLADQNIQQLNQLSIRSQEVLGIALVGGNEVTGFITQQTENSRTLLAQITQVSQEMSVLSSALSHSDTFIGRLQETLGRMPNANEILARAQQPETQPRTLETTIVESVKNAFQKIADAPREVFRAFERTLAARKAADFTHFTETWGAQKNQGTGPIKILSATEQSEGIFIATDPGADPATRRSVDKMNVLVREFVRETGLTPSPDQVSRIVDGLATGNSEILAMGAGGGKTSVIQRFMAAVNAQNGKISLHYLPNTGAQGDFNNLLINGSGGLFDAIPVLRYDSQKGWFNARTNEAVSPAEVRRLADRAAQRGEGFVALTDVDSAAWGKLSAQINVEHAVVFADLFSDTYTRVYTDEIQTFSGKNWSVTVEPPTPISQMNDPVAFQGLTGRGPGQTVGQRAIELTEQVLRSETAQQFKARYDTLVRDMEDVGTLFRDGGAQPIPADTQLVRDSYRELVEQQLRELPDVPETATARTTLGRLLEIYNNSPENFLQEFDSLRATSPTDPELSRALTDLNVRQYALSRFWDIHLLVPDTMFGLSADGQHIALRQRGAETGEMFQDAIGRVVLQLEGPRMLAAAQIPIDVPSLIKPADLLVSGRSIQLSAAGLLGDAVTVATTATPGIAQQVHGIGISGTTPARPADPSRLIIDTSSKNIISRGMQALSPEAASKALFVVNADTQVSQENIVREVISQRNQTLADPAARLKIAAIVDADGFRIIELGPNGETLQTHRFTDVEQWQKTFARYETRPGLDGINYDLPVAFQYNGQNLSPSEVLIFSNRVEQVDIAPMWDIYAVTLNSNKNTVETLQQQVARNRAWARFESEETIQNQLRNRGYTEAEISRLSETRKYEMWLRSSDPTLAPSTTVDTVITTVFQRYQTELVRQEITQNSLALANQFTQSSLAKLEAAITQDVPEQQRQQALSYARQQIAEIEKTVQIQLRKINESPQHGADAVYHAVANGHARIQGLVTEMSTRFSISSETLTRALNLEPIMSLAEFRSQLKLPLNQKLVIDTTTQPASHNQFLERLAATRTESDFTDRFYGGATSQDNRVIASWNSAVENLRAQTVRASTEESTLAPVQRTLATQALEEIATRFRPLTRLGSSLLEGLRIMVTPKEELLKQEMLPAVPAQPETTTAAPVETPPPPAESVAPAETQAPQTTENSTPVQSSNNPLVRFGSSLLEGLRIMVTPRSEFFKGDSALPPAVQPETQSLPPAPAPLPDAQAQEALKNSLLYIPEQTAQEAYAHFKTLSDDLTQKLSGGITVETRKIFEFNGQQYVVKIPRESDAARYVRSVSRGDLNMARQGLAVNVAPTTFITSEGVIVGIQRYVEGSNQAGRSSWQVLKNAGLMLTDTKNNIIETPTGPVVIDTEGIEILRELNQPELDFIRSSPLFKWWVQVDEPAAIIPPERALTVVQTPTRAVAMPMSYYQQQIASWLENSVTLTSSEPAPVIALTEDVVFEAEAAEFFAAEPTDEPVEFAQEPAEITRERSVLMPLNYAQQILAKPLFEARVRNFLNFDAVQLLGEQFKTSPVTSPVLDFWENTQGDTLPSTLVLSLRLETHTAWLQNILSTLMPPKSPEVSPASTPVETARPAAEPVSPTTPPVPNKPLGLPVTREVIGRLAENGGLEDKSISKRHAELLRDKNGNVVTIIDLESTNGTFVDGKRIKAGDEARLWDGKSVELGETEFTLRRDSDGVLQLYQADTIIIGKPVSEAAELAAEEGRPWEVVVGRDSASDIVLNASTISRTHARISRTNDGRYILTDLNSSNGTRINDVKIPPNGQVILTHGSRLDFGGTGNFIFQIGQDGGVFLRSDDRSRSIEISDDGRVDQVVAAAPKAEIPLAVEPIVPKPAPVSPAKPALAERVIIGKGDIIAGHTKNHPRGQDVARAVGKSAVIADGVTGGRAENGLRDGAVIATNRLLAALEHARTIPSLNEAKAYLQRIIDIDIQKELLSKAAELRRTQPGKHLNTTLLGTTVHSSGQLLIARVGDPEIFLFRNGKIQELDPVKTPTGNIQETREIQAWGPTRPNQLGGDSFWGAKVSSFPLQQGDKVLLTSDGFEKYFKAKKKLPQLWRILKKANTPEEGEKLLLEAVLQQQKQFEKQGLQRGKMLDDISAVSLFIGNDQSAAPQVQKAQAAQQAVNKGPSGLASLLKWFGISIGVGMLVLFSLVNNAVGIAPQVPVEQPAAVVQQEAALPPAVVEQAPNGELGEFSLAPEEAGAPQSIGKTAVLQATEAISQAGGVDWRVWFDADFVPQNLVDISGITEVTNNIKLSGDAENYLLRAEAIPHLVELAEDIKERGYILYVLDMYRGYEQQETMFNTKAEGIVVANPGTSPHQTGFALDMILIDPTGKLVDFSQEFIALAEIHGFLHTNPLDTPHFLATEALYPGATQDIKANAVLNSQSLTYATNEVLAHFMQLETAASGLQSGAINSPAGPSSDL